MNYIDTVLQSENQTVLKSELIKIHGVSESAASAFITDNRKKGLIVIVATADDSLIIGKQYADSHGIKPLNRQQYNKMYGVNAFGKVAQEDEEKALDINEFWRIPAHRMQA